MGGSHESFAERLRRQREAAGFSQEQLAERAGLSTNAIGALERGERKRPYPDTLRRLAEALGLDDETRAAWSAAVRPGAAGPSPPADAGTGPLSGPPPEPTPIIGRDDELAELPGLLGGPDRRILTLVGPGGVGKTRLALSLAHRVAEQYDDGVAWVELAPLTDHTLVLSTIGRAIGMHDAGGAAVASTLRAALRDRHALLVLDNMEHLLGAVPDLAQLLLACPGLHVLATSRAPLRLRGEQEYPVAPLEAPPAQGHADQVGAFAAVRLFLSRAREKDPSFSLTGQDDTVAAICRRLDGLPLALELVAARTRALAPAEILSRLDDPLPLLVGGPRDSPQRQQTMRAAISWSEELLGPDERAMLRRLSVFAGGWTLDAAEAVCGDGAQATGVLELVDVLVEQSLVSAQPSTHGTRYSMLEPVRQYAREQLANTGEAAQVQLRHARYFLGLAEQAAPELEGTAGQTSWVARLDRELDNIRAAMRWCEHTAGEEPAETLMRMSALLWRFWEMRWYVEEGRRWLSVALSRSEPVPPALRATALNAAGNLARDQGDHAHAKACHEQALEIRRELGDPRGTASSLNNLGVIARDVGDPARTLGLCEEAHDLFRAAGDDHGAAIALISIANAATQQGDLPRARTSYGESLAQFRATEDHWHTAWVLAYLAEVLVFGGDLDAARAHAEESLRMHREGRDPWGVGNALVVLGRVEEARGDLDGAVELYAEAVRELGAAGVEQAVPAALADLAAAVLARGDEQTAARLAGASHAWEARTGRPRARLPQADRDAVLDALAVGPQAAAWRDGTALSRDEVLREAAALARDVPV